MILRELYYKYHLALSKLICLARRTSHVRRRFAKLIFPSYLALLASSLRLSGEKTNYALSKLICFTRCTSHVL